MIELLYLYGMALSTAENKGVSPFVKISEQAFTAFFRVEFRGGIAKGNVGALEKPCQNGALFVEPDIIRHIFLIFCLLLAFLLFFYLLSAFYFVHLCRMPCDFRTRGVGGCPLGGVVGAPSSFPSAAPDSPSRPPITRRPARFGLSFVY